MNALLLLILFFFLLCCKRDNEIRLKIKEAKELILSDNPDSAYLLLKNIINPDMLDTETFAHWCLTYAGVCEQLEEDMPFVPQLERANEYYKKHGTVTEKIRILIYLGRVYEDEKSFNEAMHAYLKAVDIAKSAKEYLLVGKIYNCAAQLHKFEKQYNEAQRFYQLSGDYYLEGKDSLNYIYSIRDIGWVYTLRGGYGEASEFYLKAYDLALSLNDSLLLSSLTNRLGINYAEMKNYSLAEKYLFQSIAYDKAGSAPTYLALSDLYTLNREYKKAQSYIDLAIQHRTPNRMLKGGLLYQLYALEKELGNYSLSLDYYEQYINFADSISDIQERTNTLKVENRYEYAKLLNENNKLEIKNQWIFTISIFLLFACFLLFGMYKYRVALKNKHMLLQQKIINDKHAALLEKEIALKGLSTSVLKIRENILCGSDVYKKIIENSHSVEKARKYAMTDKDWLALIEVVKSTYTLFFENLRSYFENLTEEEVRFCCLLKLGLNSQQLSILLNILPSSVSHKRYRIMKKGTLQNTNTTLEEVIGNF